MNASPRRCSSGPQNRIGIRLEPACASMSATWALSTFVGSRTSSPSSGPPVTCTPCSSSRPETIRTSAISGTPRSRLTPSPSSEATIALETRFLAPRTVTSPCSGVPPWTVNTSFMPTSMTNERAGTRHRVPARRPCRGAASGLLGGAARRRPLGGGPLGRRRGGGSGRGGLGRGLAGGLGGRPAGCLGRGLLGALVGRLGRAPGGTLRRRLGGSRGLGRGGGLRRPLGRGLVGGLGGRSGARRPLRRSARGGCVGRLRGLLRRRLPARPPRRCRRLSRLRGGLAGAGRRRGRLGLGGGGLPRTARAPPGRGRTGGRGLAGHGAGGAGGRPGGGGRAR